MRRECGEEAVRVEAEVRIGDDTIKNAGGRYEGMSQQLGGDVTLRRIPLQSRNGGSVMNRLMSRCYLLGAILRLINRLGRGRGSATVRSWRLQFTEMQILAHVPRCMFLWPSVLALFFWHLQIPVLEIPVLICDLTPRDRNGLKRAYSVDKAVRGFVSAKGMGRGRVYPVPKTVRR